MSLSVCMATYNGARFLGEQVSSILYQLGHDDELVVVDDGSRDDTVALLSDIGDARIRVTVNERNLGPIGTFERALCLTRGEIVFLADQDDVWLPNKVQRMVAALASADLVVSDCRVVDDALHTLHPSFFELRQSGPGLLRNLVRNSYLGCCIALRRELLRRVLPFPPGVPMHDWWIGLVAEAFGRVIFLDEPLLLYRRHDSNVSTTAQRSSATLRMQFAWRWRVARALLKRYVSRRK